MEYICILKDGSRRETWTGELHLLRGASGQYEAEINGRGTYFHILAGWHKYGNYLCIPKEPLNKSDKHEELRKSSPKNR